MKRSVYEKQGGICPICKEHFDYEFMEGDHIIAWHDGGKTLIENLQMLCKMCNRTKSGK
jgi:5-methylcytosine-specific restriction endonuclease McrA